MAARIGGKTGGRRRGSLDRGERLVISEKLAGDILKTYKRLGPDWLFKVAQDRPDLFINQCLSRLLPPIFKEDGGEAGTYNTQINIGNLTEREIASRVAFALSKAIYDDPSVVIDHAPMTPQEACRVPETFIHEGPPPEPIDNPAQAEWAASLPLSPQERADQLLIRETKESSITNYHGNPAEQGGGSIQRQAPDRPLTVNEIRRRQLL